MIACLCAEKQKGLGKKYGLQPKFVRMREMHSLLQYLIYCYTGQTDLDQAQAKGRQQKQDMVVKYRIVDNFK